MTDRLATLWTDESGVAMPEYALILALLSIGLLAVLVIFRDSIGWVFERMADVLITGTESVGGYQPTA